MIRLDTKTDLSSAAQDLRALADKLERNELTEILILYKDRDGEQSWRCDGEDSASMVWGIEHIKHHLLFPNSD
jgi:hypothetical protein